MSPTPALRPQSHPLSPSIPIHLPPFSVNILAQPFWEPSLDLQDLWAAPARVESMAVAKHLTKEDAQGDHIAID